MELGVDRNLELEDRFCLYRTSKHRSALLKSEYCIKLGCLTRESLEDSIIDSRGPLKEGFSGVIYNICEYNEGHITGKCDKVLKVIPLSENDTPEDLFRGSITYDCNPLDLGLINKNRKNADCVVTTIPQFQEEVDIAKLADEIGIGPKIYDSWICSDVELKIKKLEGLEGLEGLENEEWSDDSQILGFILMEKLQGETLADFVESHPKLFQENFYILLRDGIDKALKLESRGYKHEDLHSKNIFVVDNGMGIMFIDYGDVSPFPEEFRYIQELFTMESFLQEMMSALRQVF